MGVVPKKPLERIQFYENHIAPFTTNATAIGLTTSEVTSLSTKTAAARSAYSLATAARQASETATNAYYDAVETMTVAGAGLLKKIRGQAETTGNANVYNLAQIPAPATPTNRGAPGEPGSIKGKLENNGALTLTWKCANPAGTSGTSYMVWRRIGETSLVFLGATGEKKFVDATIPAGTVLATYQIQGFRSTMAGPWAQFNVNFTTEVGGVTTAAISPVTAKLAA